MSVSVCVRLQVCVYVFKDVFNDRFTNRWYALPSALESMDVKAIGTKLNVSWVTEEDQPPGFFVWLEVFDSSGTAVHQESVESSPYIVETARPGQ